jgi:hypothetical protein
MRLGLVVLVGCDAGLAPPTTPPPEPPPAAPLAPVSDGHGGWYAIVRAERGTTECSNMGGEHITLSIVDRQPGQPTWLHLGGHGNYRALPCDRRYVAHVVATPPLVVDDPGWCLDEQPTYDGKILALSSVGPDPAATLVHAAKVGLPDAIDPLIAVSGNPPLINSVSTWIGQVDNYVCF